MSIFEILMLLCFGFAWPVSIYKSYVSKQNGGKSLLFLLVVFVGYVSGTIHKVLYSPDVVVWLYVLNGVMVGIDMLLYYRNWRLGRGQSESGG